MGKWFCAGEDLVAAHFWCAIATTLTTKLNNLIAPLGPGVFSCSGVVRDRAVGQRWYELFTNDNNHDRRIRSKKKCQIILIKSILFNMIVAERWTFWLEYNNWMLSTTIVIWMFSHEFHLQLFTDRKAILLISKVSFNAHTFCPKRAAGSSICLLYA